MTPGFNFELTKDHIRDILRGNPSPDEWWEVLIAVLPRYEINTVDRVACFLAQCGHESNNFTVLEENLNYSADGLNKIFPKYFKNAGRDAAQYARQPEKIANVVYADRMGNGNTASGDGYRHRGRGLIQLTGKDNYSKFAGSLKIDTDTAIRYLGSKQGAVESACWYWATNQLNQYCDAQDMKTLTKRINGGYIGLDDRIKHYEHAVAVLGGKVKPAAANLNETVRLGSRGPTVAAVQTALGIGSDGVFGPGTEASLKAWQKYHGLTADGIAGPTTLSKLLK